jgi:hypothetical protein
MMTMNNGRFYLPSRNRPKSLERFFQSYRETGAVCPGWVVLNADDWEANRAAYEALALPAGWSFSLAGGELPAMAKVPAAPIWGAVKAMLPGLSQKESAVTPQPVDSMCGAMRVMWPTMKELDWVGWADDDYFPETPGWDVKMVEALRGYNFVSTNDCWKARADVKMGRMCGAWAFSGDLLRAVGYLVPAGLKKSYVDDVWETIGRATGTWETRMDVVVRHLHPETGLAAADDTNNQVVKNWPNDTKAFTRWKKTEAGRAIERVKAILP